MPAGRPSKFKPEFVAQAGKLCADLGATNPDLAKFFEVDVSTIDDWIATKPEFSGAIKEGKRAFDDNQVVKSLKYRAIGYKHEAVKIFNEGGIPLEVKYIEHYPPDTAACIFWLKNRRRDEWRDKVETGITDKDGNDVTLVIGLKEVK